MISRNLEESRSESQVLLERVAKLEREQAEMAERLDRLEAASGTSVDEAREVLRSAPSAPSLPSEAEELAAILSPVDGSLGDPVLGDQLDVLGLGSFAVATIGVSSINFFELSFDLPADFDSLQAGSFVIGSVTVREPECGRERALVVGQLDR